MSRSRIAVLSLAALGSLASPLAPISAKALVYNASASAPRGWYWVSRPLEIRVGDVVLAPLPQNIANLADARHYLPLAVPILKRVGALEPERVCIRGMWVQIGTHIVAERLERDGAGRPLPAWQGCRALMPGELFLLNTTHRASFDSRYFGPIPSASVLGVARPLWTWP